MIKKQKSIAASKTLKKSSSSEEKWFCVAVIVILVVLAYVITTSLKNANERFVKSDYYISINNHLYNLQSENSTALLISFKPRSLKNTATTSSSALFVDAFTEAVEKTKFYQLKYEVLRTAKTEVLAKLYIQNNVT